MNTQFTPNVTLYLCVAVRAERKQWNYTIPAYRNCMFASKLKKNKDRKVSIRDAHVWRFGTQNRARTQEMRDLAQVNAIYCDWPHECDRALHISPHHTQIKHKSKTFSVMHSHTHIYKRDHTHTKPNENRSYDHPARKPRIYYIYRGKYVCAVCVYRVSQMTRLSFNGMIEEIIYSLSVEISRIIISHPRNIVSFWDTLCVWVCVNIRRTAMHARARVCLYLC